MISVFTNTYSNSNLKEDKNKFEYLAFSNIFYTIQSTILWLSLYWYRVFFSKWLVNLEIVCLSQNFLVGAKTRLLSADRSVWNRVVFIHFHVCHICQFVVRWNDETLPSRKYFPSFFPLLFNNHCALTSSIRSDWQLEIVTRIWLDGVQHSPNFFIFKWWGNSANIRFIHFDMRGSDIKPFCGLLASSWYFPWTENQYWRHYNEQSL